MNKLVLVLLFAGMVASEAPLKRNFSRRLFQRQEQAPQSEYGAPEATTKAQGYQYPTPEKPFEDGESSGDTQTDSGYLPPEQSTTDASQEGGYQYPTPAEPFEEGPASGSSNTEGQAERLRVKGIRNARFQKLTQSRSPQLLTIVPSVELVNLF